MEAASKIKQAKKESRPFLPNAGTNAHFGLQMV